MAFTTKHQKRVSLIIILSLSLSALAFSACANHQTAANSMLIADGRPVLGEDTIVHAATKQAPQTRSKQAPQADTGASPADQAVVPALASAHVLGSYSTSYKGGTEGRIHNIELASQKIDGVVVKPGETFSFNSAVGPTSKANGFQKAQIFVKGIKKKGYGGGVCQVSSTLFNAADRAGLEITERHLHSLMVSYVPDGRDAATSHGGIDFKFVNNRPASVTIRATAKNDTLTVSIEG